RTRGPPPRGPPAGRADLPGRGRPGLGRVPPRDDGAGPADDAAPPTPRRRHLRHLGQPPPRRVLPQGPGLPAPGPATAAPDGLRGAGPGVLLRPRHDAPERPADAPRHLRRRPA